MPPTPAGPAAGSAPEDPRRMRVIVVYGGASPEHEVSCRSARTVLDALDPARYAVEVVGIATDGRWVGASEVVDSLPAGTPSLPDPDALLDGGAPAGDPVALVGSPLLPAGLRPDPSLDGVPVVAWPVLHGPMGEDGTVQGLLELAGVAYVGAGVAGSAAAMDKGLAKTAFAGARIPQARWLRVRAGDVAGADAPTGLADLAKAVEAGLGWPVYVKPANMGSSIGVSRAGGIEELAAAVADAAAYDDDIIVEEAITGRELEIGVLGLDPMRTSRVGEIVPTAGTYSYDDKYVDGTAELRIPAAVAEDVTDEMALLAVEACRALRVEGMARVDFFYDEGADRLYLNEVNTLPGFTSISMYPALWAASGLPVAQLADELVRLALVRHERRAQHRRTR